jgi:hypothetical protein
MPVRQTVTALYRLTRLPVDYGDAILAGYPALKLGLRESTVRYARRLMPLAEALIAGDPQPAGWVLTAPPYHTIPAAANLLCSELFDRLEAGLPATLDLSFIKLAEQMPSFDGDQPPADYARLDWRERTASRERSANTLLPHAGLTGRAIVFVNDINVTGAQQRLMHRYFEQAGASAVHWLYVIDVEESLGRESPEIEYQINNSQFEPISEFATIIAEEPLIFTSKCVARIFSYDKTDLGWFFDIIPANKKEALLDLVRREPRYHGDYFRRKIELLEDRCSR